MKQNVETLQDMMEEIEMLTESPNQDENKLPMGLKKLYDNWDRLQIALLEASVLDSTDREFVTSLEKSTGSSDQNEQAQNITGEELTIKGVENHPEDQSNSMESSMPLSRMNLDQDQIPRDQTAISENQQSISTLPKQVSNVMERELLSEDVINEARVYDVMASIDFDALDSEEMMPRIDNKADQIKSIQYTGNDVANENDQTNNQEITEMSQYCVTQDDHFVEEFTNKIQELDKLLEQQTEKSKKGPKDEILGTLKIGTATCAPKSEGEKNGKGRQKSEEAEDLSSSIGSMISDSSGVYSFDHDDVHYNVTDTIGSPLTTIYTMNKPITCQTTVAQSKVTMATTSDSSAKLSSVKSPASGRSPNRKPSSKSTAKASFYRRRRTSPKSNRSSRIVKKSSKADHTSQILPSEQISNKEGEIPCGAEIAFVDVDSNDGTIRNHLSNDDHDNDDFSGSDGTVLDTETRLLNSGNDEADSKAIGEKEKQATRRGFVILNPIFAQPVDLDDAQQENNADMIPRKPQGIVDIKPNENTEKGKAISSPQTATKVESESKNSARNPKIKISTQNTTTTTPRSEVLPNLKLYAFDNVVERQRKNAFIAGDELLSPDSGELDFAELFKKLESASKSSGDTSNLLDFDQTDQLSVNNGPCIKVIPPTPRKSSLSSTSSDTASKAADIENSFELPDINVIPATPRRNSLSGKSPQDKEGPVRSVPIVTNVNGPQQVFQDENKFEKPIMRRFKSLIDTPDINVIPPTPRRQSLDLSAPDIKVIPPTPRRQSISSENDAPCVPMPPVAPIVIMNDDENGNSQDEPSSPSFLSSIPSPIMPRVWNWLEESMFDQAIGTMDDYQSVGVMDETLDGSGQAALADVGWNKKVEGETARYAGFENMSRDITPVAAVENNVEVETDNSREEVLSTIEVAAVVEQSSDFYGRVSSLGSGLLEDSAAEEKENKCKVTSVNADDQARLVKDDTEVIFGTESILNSDLHDLKREMYKLDDKDVVMIPHEISEDTQSPKVISCESSGDPQLHKVVNDLKREEENAKCHNLDNKERSVSLTTCHGSEDDAMDDVEKMQLIDQDGNQIVYDDAHNEGYDIEGSATALHQKMTKAVKRSEDVSQTQGIGSAVASNDVMAVTGRNEEKEPDDVENERREELSTPSIKEEILQSHAIGILNSALYENEDFAITQEVPPAGNDSANGDISDGKSFQEGTHKIEDEIFDQIGNQLKDVGAQQLALRQRRDSGSVDEATSGVTCLDDLIDNETQEAVAAGMDSFYSRIRNCLVSMCKINELLVADNEQVDGGQEELANYMKVNFTFVLCFMLCHHQHNANQGKSAKDTCSAHKTVFFI